MHIAVANSKFASPHLGGGVASLLTLLEGFNRNTPITVEAFQSPPVEKINLNFEYEVCAHEPHSFPAFHWIDTEMYARSWENYLSKKNQTRYDLSICQGTLGVSVLNDIESRASILFIISLLSTGYYQYHPSKSHISNILRADVGGKLQYPFVLRNHWRYKQAVNSADVVVANSEFTASKIEDMYGIEPEIIYPPINISDYEVEYDSKGYITIVNPRNRNKGGDIFLDLAAMMPNEKFLIVGEVPQNLMTRVRKLNNVTYEPWCDDMRDIYGRSKIIVVPTRIVETFGRVPAEAMVSGIPCIVSNRGGLPSVVGDTGYIVENPESIDEWIEKIRVAKDDNLHKERKQRVRQKFTAEKQVKKFSRIVNSLIDK